MSSQFMLQQPRRFAGIAGFLLAGLSQPSLAQPVVATADNALNERAYLVSASPQPTNLPAFNKSTSRDASGPDEALTRIVGGYAAPTGKWPSMVALYMRLPNRPPQFFCGGTVIDAEWVLTAAHCLTQVNKSTGQILTMPPDALMVREGTINLDIGGRAVNARNIIIHKDYRPGINDIALIQLAGPVEAPRQQLISGAAVPLLVTPGRMATTMGFGLVQALKARTSKEDQGALPRSQQLLQVDVPIVGKPKCASSYKERVATGATLCAGRDDGGADTCPGDSGGPLFVRDDVGQALQAGVVSWGFGCAQPMAWGIYASVGHFEDWIKSHVANASFGGNARPAGVEHAPPAQAAGAQAAVGHATGGQPSGPSVAITSAAGPARNPVSPANHRGRLDRISTQPVRPGHR
jgi:secreted trypsin-like serine protease